MKALATTLAAVAMTGCAITPQNIADVSASSRPVGDTLALLAATGACADGAALWNLLAPEDKTITAESGIVEACTLLTGIAGSMSPITATVYTSERERVCAVMPRGHYYTHADAYGIAREKVCG